MSKVYENILLPLSDHALETLQNLARLHEPNYESGDSKGQNKTESVKSTLKTSPFCFETPGIKKELRGWVLDMEGNTPASNLPIPNNLFHGISTALCDISESKILSMLQNIEETKTNLKNAIEKVFSKSNETNSASWRRCKPTTYSGYPLSLYIAKKEKDGSIAFEKDDNCSSNHVPIIDSDSWEVELSPDGFIGFYHQWSTTHLGNKLSLYCICQSYLPLACQEFSDLVYKVGDFCDVATICLSEEAQWLRSACSRNRSRIIYEICKEMGINVPHVNDYNSYQDKEKIYRMALATNETFHHDILINSKNTKEKNKRVYLLNYCCETKSSFNGIACVMAPWEGVWLFEGLNCVQNFAKRQVSGVVDFGKSYGDSILCTCSPFIDKKNMLNGNSYTFVNSNQFSGFKNLNVWDEKQIKCNKAEILHDFVDLNLKDEKGLLLNTEGMDSIIIDAYQNYIKKRKNVQQHLLLNSDSQEFSINHDSNDSIQGNTDKYYLIFDERIMSVMAKYGWSRNQNIIKLMPLVCGLYDDWKESQIE